MRKLYIAREGQVTRTELQEDGKSVWWSVEDEIAVCYGPSEVPAVFISQNTEPAKTTSR